MTPGRSVRTCRTCQTTCTSASTSPRRASSRRPWPSTLLPSSALGTRRARPPRRAGTGLRLQGQVLPSAVVKSGFECCAQTPRRSPRSLRTRTSSPPGRPTSTSSTALLRSRLCCGSRLNFMDCTGSWCPRRCPIVLSGSATSTASTAWTRTRLGAPRPCSAPPRPSRSTRASPSTGATAMTTQPPQRWQALRALAAWAATLAV
mmetsp:Transcript_5993/g.17492  ORF Transcript_5993/g.17492 Transcript_5993/m.17492 type:complete len:204 (+) Transcript_5993:190-801(+)